MVVEFGDHQPPFADQPVHDPLAMRANQGRPVQDEDFWGCFASRYLGRAGGRCQIG